ncbi:hypothetical protein ACFPRL_20030 [Pseudoclavibacter helvolus]
MLPLTVWFQRQRSARLTRLVGPPSDAGIVWSRSQFSAGSRQPGKRQCTSRARSQARMASVGR